jgi:hypothetical protein
MSIHINDPGLEVALGLMEGDGQHACWNGEGDNTLAGVRKHYASLLAEAKRDGLPLLPRRSCGTIYGFGGFNRYFVRGDGRVVFSTYHATESKAQDAQDVGFDLNE